MLDLEIVAGAERAPVGSQAPGPALRRAARATLEAGSVSDGHLAVALVSSGEIRELNRAHRDRDEPTDVLSFPVDERAAVGPRELGDVVICPDLADELDRAVVHGVLHLLGLDHETDRGEMLALEERIMRGLR